MLDNKQHSHMVSAYFAYCVSILGKIDNKPHVWVTSLSTLKMEYADHAYSKELAHAYAYCLFYLIWTHNMPNMPKPYVSATYCLAYFTYMNTLIKIS
jgi:hypothetical protein